MNGPFNMKLRNIFDYLTVSRQCVGEQTYLWLVRARVEQCAPLGVLTYVQSLVEIHLTPVMNNLPGLNTEQQDALLLRPQQHPGGGGAEEGDVVMER